MKYDNKRSDERIRRLMMDVGMPNSMSLHHAMKQLEMEVRLECEKPDADLVPDAEGVRTFIG